MNPDAVLSTIFQIAGNTSLAATDRVKSIVRVVADQLLRGPCVVYVRDWQNSGTNLEDDYVLWFMTGVAVPAPMFGVIPKDTIAWMEQKKVDGTVMDSSKLSASGGNVSGFWTREKIVCHIKYILNEGRDVIFFNKRSQTEGEPETFDEGTLAVLSTTAAIVEPLLATVRKEGPTHDQVSRNHDIERRTNWLSERLLRGHDHDKSDDLVGEILNAAHSLVAGRGPVLCAIYEMQRTVIDGKLQLVLQGRDYCGIPSQWLTKSAEDTYVLKLHEPRTIEPKKNGARLDWQGITSWVAYHGIGLLVDDLRTYSADSPLPLHAWFNPVWQGVRSEIAVPIRDPHGGRLWGVLNLESRLKGVFVSDDVYWLERFAQHVGRILRADWKSKVLDELRIGSQRLTGDPKIGETVARVVADFFLADDVTIWVRPFKVEGRAVLEEGASFYRLGPVRPVPPTVRATKGWTTGFFSSAKATPPKTGTTTGPENDIVADKHDPLHFEIAYVKQADTSAFWQHYQGNEDNPEHWLRVSRFSLDPRTGERIWTYCKPAFGVNPAVLKQGFRNQLAVPLFVPRQPTRDSRLTTRSDADDSRSAEFPVGLLWASWGAWKGGESKPRPSLDEMEILDDVASQLALLLDTKSVLDNGQTMGVKHDAVGHLYDHAARESHARGLTGICHFIEWIRRLPKIYRHSSESFSPLVIERRKWAGREVKTIGYVRELLRVTIAIAFGAYELVSSETALFDGDELALPNRLNDWRVTFGTIGTEYIGKAGLTAEASEFYEILTLLINLVSNTYRYPVEPAKQGDATRYSLDVGIVDAVPSNPASIELLLRGFKVPLHSDAGIRVLISETANRRFLDSQGGLESEPVKWVVFHVRNPLPTNVAEVEDEIKRAILLNFAGRRYGYGLIKFLALEKRGGSIHVACSSTSEKVQTAQRQFHAILCVPIICQDGGGK